MSDLNSNQNKSMKTFKAPSPGRSLNRQRKFNKLISQIRKSNEKVELEPTGSVVETMKWLKANKFEHLIPIFCKYNCQDMLTLTVEEAVSKCGHLQGTRLFYKIHKTKPSKMFYFRLINQNTDWKPIAFTSLTTEQLIEFLCETFNVKHEQSKYYLVMVDKNLKFLICDEHLRQIPDKSMFHINIESDAQSCRLQLLKYL